MGRWGQRYCCTSTGEETFLSLTCSPTLYSLPHPICNEQSFGPQVHPAVLSSPHSWQAFGPLGPRHSSLPVSPPLDIPAPKRHSSCSKSCCTPLWTHLAKAQCCSVAWLSFHSHLEHTDILQTCMLCKESCRTHTVTWCHVTHDLFCVTKHEFLERMGCNLLFFVSGKSLSEGHSWHVPDSPSCPKHRYKQMEGDRNVPPIPSDSSTPYQPACVSLDPLGV